MDWTRRHSGFGQSQRQQRLYLRICKDIPTNNHFTSFLVQRTKRGKRDQRGEGGKHVKLGIRVGKATMVLLPRQSRALVAEQLPV